MYVFHKSDSQADLKINEVREATSNEVAFFMPMDGWYLKNAGAIFKECFGGTPGLRSLAASLFMPRIGLKNRLERFLTWWMPFPPWPEGWSKIVCTQCTNAACGTTGKDAGPGLATWMYLSEPV